MQISGLKTPPAVCNWVTGSLGQHHPEAYECGKAPLSMMLENYALSIIKTIKLTFNNNSQVGFHLGHSFCILSMNNWHWRASSATLFEQPILWAYSFALFPIWKS